MKRHNRGHALRAWRQSNDTTIATLAARVGDAPTGQISKFEIGTRDLSLRMACDVSKLTGLPLRKLLTRQQMNLAKTVFALMARDAAG